MANKIRTPKTPAVLILIGGLLILFSGFLAVLGAPTGFTFMEGHLMIQLLQGISVYHGFIEAVCGIVLIVMAKYINSVKIARAQNGIIVALIFSIISLFGGGGFFVGFMLAFVGSILGAINMYITMWRSAYSKPLEKSRITDNGAKIGSPEKLLIGLKTEEKKIYKIAEEAGGAIFQADLVDKSGFSKVKISRLLDKLEGIGLIERKRRGMTNMVIIKRDSGI